MSKLKGSSEKIKEVTPEIVDVAPIDISKEKESLKSSLVKKTNAIIKAQTKALSPTDPLAQYLIEIKKYKLLTAEEEKEIAIKYKETGDSEYAERLVTANLRFVVKVASEYNKFGGKLLDLIQEGNVGLMHAVKEFNPYKGVKLITYAVWWIRGYIQEYLMKQQSLVKIGTTQNQKKLYYKLKKQDLSDLNDPETLKQLSGDLGIDEKEVREMSKRLGGNDVSLSQPLNNSDSGTLMDFQSSKEEESVDNILTHYEEISHLKNKIESLKSELNEKELFLLEERLLSEDPLTLQEIGKKRGVSREAVRQMEVRVLKKIKDRLQE
ncbi:MAG: RNA polymerase factor sigma-32 [Bdellovibrionaceae bacterium]|jgi:RNA polymerase sigma-32 factor|nr:RNA polymerase factor sigma-32 [Pseudobdellovibrionaceae bacterium]